RYPWAAGDEALGSAVRLAAGSAERFGRSPSAQVAEHLARHVGATVRAALWLVQDVLERDPAAPGEPAAAVGPVLTAARAALLVDRTREAATLLARLLELLSDARGCDLTHLRLEGVPLDGVRWTPAEEGGTRWPPHLADA